MTCDEAKNKIDKYIHSDKNLPIIVDVPNSRMLTELLSDYKVGKNKIIKANKTDYCPKDSLPQMDKLQNDLSKSGDVMLLDGLSVFLLLQGKSVLINTLKSLMELFCPGKLIILTLGCAAYLYSLDKRYFSSGRIILAEGEKEELPVLDFIAKDLPKPECCIDGINGLPRMTVFLEAGQQTISIVTNKTKKDFPDSLFEIKQYISAFQVIKDSYPELSAIDEKAGTNGQWSELQTALSKTGSWGEYVNESFGDPNNLIHNIPVFSTYNEFKKWAYFLALRIYGAKGNEYLTGVIQGAETYDSFVTGIFCSILKEKPGDVHFDKLYNERKAILSQMTDYPDEMFSFCKQVLGKERDGLYYLTDLTQQEKELAIGLIAKYAEDYPPARLQSILENVYPDLALYLSPFNFNDDFLNRYFNQYKYCKVINKILPEFRAMMEEQATKRDYNKLLRPRTSFLDALMKDKDKTKLYFIDAMGVEFLSYFQNKCFEKRLDFKANIARCELPSITSLNKEFVEEFSLAGCPVFNNKELDELKHEGQNSYNYENTKLPIHIVRELQIIDELVDNLKSSLEHTQRAYIIADHGATRLAVINETENKWEVAEKGKHSGRCCPKTELNEKPDFATEENDFWCLANYDRFKGGRKALVEVHGGATLEEVAIPIIEVKKITKKIVCRVCDEKPIFISFRKKAKLKIYAEVDTDKISISVNGHNYKARTTNIPYQYEVDMPDVKKAGIYRFAVYSEGILIARDLTFEVNKEGASEKNLF